MPAAVLLLPCIARTNPPTTAGWAGRSPLQAVWHSCRPRISGALRPPCPSYPDHPNADLLERIPLDAAVVLDVGCGAGSLGAAYRRFNPRARLLGIDQDPAAAALAAQRLDDVAVVDVEQDPLPFELDRPIDCIIYGDVLEHLRDPWAVLRRHIAALSDDGTILICVPNLEHWSFADRLLRGTWDYEPSGLLDDTHLRWFSLETMRKGLLALGLSLCDVHARIFDAAGAEAFTTRIAPGADGARCRSAGLCAARRAAAICLARAQAPARAADGGRQHAGAGGRRFACPRRLSAAGAAQRSDGRHPHRHEPGRS